jgi:hypothetical protein
LVEISNEEPGPIYVPSQKLIAETSFNKLQLKSTSELNKTFPETLKVPLISNVYSGLLVPIPTFPPL